MRLIPDLNDLVWRVNESGIIGDTHMHALASHSPSTENKLGRLHMNTEIKFYLLWP